MKKVLLLVLLLALLAVPATAFADGIGAGVVENIVTETEGNGGPGWIVVYHITQVIEQPDISHVTIAVPECLTVREAGVGVSETLIVGGGEATVGYDPTTNLTGVKWDDVSPDYDFYYFIVDGPAALGLTVTAVKAGPGHESGFVDGAMCEWAPLDINLGYFRADHQGDSVIAQWEALEDGTTSGYHIYAGGIRLNTELLPSHNDGDLANEMYIDVSQASDPSLFLYIEEVDTDGIRHRRGPFLMGVDHGQRSYEDIYIPQAMAQ